MSRMYDYDNLEKKFKDLKETETTKLDELTGLRFKLFMYLTKSLTQELHLMNKQNIHYSKVLSEGDKSKVFDQVLTHMIDTNNINKEFLTKDNKLTEEGQKHYKDMFQGLQGFFDKWTGRTKFKIICMRFPEYKPNHINNELKKMIKLGLVGKDTIDGNFKSAYYYSILDRYELAISFIRYIGSIRLYKNKIHSYTNFELARVKRLFEYNAMLFDEINIENLREYYREILIPSILADKSYNKKDYDKYIGNYFQDDKLIKYIKDIVQDREKSIMNTIKLSKERFQ